MADPPTHLLHAATDTRTLCGLKADGRDAAYPQMLVRFLPAHVRGYGCTACTDCAHTVLDQGGTP